MSPTLAAGARVLADAIPARGVEPAAALRALAGPGSVLLESGEGRWSYLAPWPAAVLSRRDPAGALDEARVLLDRFAADVPAGAPPFTGGLIGSLGYDLVRALEVIPQLARDDLALPAIQLAAVDSLYAFDRARDELWVVARAERELRRLREGLERVRPVAAPPAPGGELRGMPYAHYRARVERVLDHIGRGDVYEVNYTQRLEGNCASSLDLYARLRAGAPVPYNLYLDAGGWQLVGATPETFLRVSSDGVCVTRPIKGTRPRGADPTRDAQLAYELQTSPKELAELVMITDLLRNDLGKVCEFGSVQTPELARLEKFAQVQHLVSTVEGRLRKDMTHFAAFASCFPGGSITGAPKFRAMEIIDELEPVSRGPYCGAIGYLGFNRESQLSITIRTAVCKDGLAHFNVGAGIVADSNPEAEHEETLAKARGFFAALENGGSQPGDRPIFHKQSLRPGSQTTQFHKTK